MKSAGLHYLCILPSAKGSIAGIGRAGLRLLSNDEWAALVKAGQQPGDAFIRKTYASTIAKASDAPGNVLDFTISTADRDRHRDTVAVNGWDVENYKANPVVLWAHDYDALPVAKALTIGASAAALVSRAQFPDHDLNAFGFMVYRLLCEQYLRATSVGFIPMEWTYDEEAGGYNILSQELLEYSIVPVPANPNTLQNAIGKGIDLAPYVGWVERALDEIAAPGVKAVNISRDVLERVIKIAKPSTSTTVAGKGNQTVADIQDPFKSLMDNMKSVVAAAKAAGKQGDPETCAFVAKAMHLHVATLGYMSAALIESLGLGDDEDAPTEDTVAARGLLVRELLTSATKHLGVMAKAGARHSTGDKAMIKEIHELCVKLGYECKPAEESDDEKAARVAREKAAKPPTPAADDDTLALAIGDDVDLSTVSAAEMGEMIRDTMKSTLAAATGRLD